MTKEKVIPGMGLFGLQGSDGVQYSNRFFNKPSGWTKNIFNNAFPVSLACWMGEHDMPSVYLKLDTSLHVVKDQILTDELFGLRPLSPGLFYHFESSFGARQTLLIEPMPGIDLVTYDKSSKPDKPLRGIEIKLTALPDNTTAESPPDQYGCEIVIRPDTIIYLAMGIAAAYEQDQATLYKLLDPVCGGVGNWHDANHVSPLLSQMRDALNQVMLSKLDSQEPLVLHPIWRTEGQKLLLAPKCFDVFVWSNFAFTRLFMDATFDPRSITRPTRSVVWLTNMLYEFSLNGKFSTKIIDITYGTKNDKAFSVTGKITRALMACTQLSTPRVSREIVREIILGGGQDYLQPERRLDAAILTTPNLFPPPPIRDVSTMPEVIEEPSEIDQ